MITIDEEVSKIVLINQHNLRLRVVAINLISYP